MQTRATCSWDRALNHLGVTSNLEQIGCVVLPLHMTNTCERESSGRSPGPSNQANLYNVWKLAEPHSVMNYSNLIVWVIIIDLMYGAQLRV